MIQRGEGPQKRVVGLLRRQGGDAHEVRHPLTGGSGQRHVRPRRHVGDPIDVDAVRDSDHPVCGIGELPPHVLRIRERRCDDRVGMAQDQRDLRSVGGPIREPGQVAPVHRRHQPHPHQSSQCDEEGGVRLDIMHVHHLDPATPDEPGEVPERRRRSEGEARGRDHRAARGDRGPQVHVDGRKPEPRRSKARRRGLAREQKERLAIPRPQRAGQVADDGVHSPLFLIPGHDDQDSGSPEGSLGYRRQDGLCCGRAYDCVPRCTKRRGT